MKMVIIYQILGRDHHYLFEYQNLAHQEHPINTDWQFIVKTETKNLQGLLAFKIIHLHLIKQNSIKQA